jgi:tetratricopeptide (TPR) repeat protein
MDESIIAKWLAGQRSLGEACGWKIEEVRLVTELGYALAEQGREREAITIFEGLAALSPANGYFQSALGALRLRLGEPRRAVEHLTVALTLGPRDLTQDLAVLINRGEAYMMAGEPAAASRDLQRALMLGESRPDEARKSATSLMRARALLERLQEPDQRAALESPQV